MYFTDSYRFMPQHWENCILLCVVSVLSFWYLQQNDLSHSDCYLWRTKTTKTSWKHKEWFIGLPLSNKGTVLNDLVHDLIIQELGSLSLCLFDAHGSISLLCRNHLYHYRNKFLEDTSFARPRSTLHLSLNHLWLNSRAICKEMEAKCVP